MLSFINLFEALSDNQKKNIKKAGIAAGAGTAAGVGIHKELAPRIRAHNLEKESGKQLARIHNPKKDDNYDYNKVRDNVDNAAKKAIKERESTLSHHVKKYFNPNISEKDSTINRIWKHAGNIAKKQVED